MRQLALAFALAASLLPTTACASIPPVPTELPSSVTIDDKVGIGVETAYQAANLAGRIAIRTHLATPAQAARIAALDNQAYTYVCYTRTAYDLANHKDPASRVDGCAPATKQGRYVSYAEAARSALLIINSLVAVVGASTAGK